MERSWLVQRLQKPAGARDNPFSFGGGLRNGGLSDEAMGLLRGLFSFDYMGAAEFEFGAVPEALQRMAKAAGELAAFSFSITLADVEKPWRDKGPVPDGDATVYVLCRAEWRQDVEARIRGWASGTGEKLKESTQLASSLRPVEEWHSRIVGWLELTNGFMFFTDRAMWEGASKLFGVELPDAVEA